MKKLHFEDSGQDFLWWTVDEEGIVQDCGPFQASVWVGSVIPWHDTLKPGHFLDFRNKHSSEILKLKHRILAIENI